jgi:hypothetical protein
MIATSEVKYACEGLGEGLGIRVQHLAIERELADAFFEARESSLTGTPIDRIALANLIYLVRVDATKSAITMHRRAQKAEGELAKYPRMIEGVCREFWSRHMALLDRNRALTEENERLRRVESARYVGLYKTLRAFGTAVRVFWSEIAWGVRLARRARKTGR